MCDLLFFVVVVSKAVITWADRGAEARISLAHHASRQNAPSA